MEKKIRVASELLKTARSLLEEFTGAEASPLKPVENLVDSVNRSKQKVFGKSSPLRTQRDYGEVRTADDLRDDNLFFVGEYYDEGGRNREMCHRIKDGDAEAIEIASEEMARKVPSNSVLIPIPSHTGRATYTLDLAKAIASKSNSKVLDVLEGVPRETIYSMKKNGRIDLESLRMHLTEPLPKGKTIVFIDNVVASGTTANEALSHVDSGCVLSYAVDSHARSKSPEDEKSIKVARSLVHIARMLVAFNRNELENQLKKKRSDLKEDALKEYLDCLEEMDAKEQKAALYWINKKRLILPEDLSKFNEAMNLINKQRLDFQKFDGPMEVVNRNDKSTLRIKSQDAHFNPSSEKAFSNPYNAGDGVVIYKVKNSKEGQLAVRKAIDSNWGYDKNPWCLAARKGGFNQNEINALSDEQAEKLGFYSDDALAVAWNYWNNYNAYPKRIAFKSGKLLAFSAGDKKQRVEWWDKNDEPHYAIPGSDAMDDIEFLKRYGKYNLLESQNASPEVLEELAEDKDLKVRHGVAKNPKTPSEILRKLAEDEDAEVRYEVAENSSTPVEVLMKLAEHQDVNVRYAVARNPSTPAQALRKLAEDTSFEVILGVAANPNTPTETLMKLAEDKFLDVRYAVTENPNTPGEVLKKLAEDEDAEVRYAVAANSKTPAEVLSKLVEDENLDVRKQVAENPSTPVEILSKLVEDKNWKVRYEVAMNPRTPVEILRKLAEDEHRDMRDGVARNPSTPAEVLRKLAEDEDELVRKIAKKRQLKQ